MKKNISVIIIWFVIIAPHILFASENEVRWGGPGYDSALKGESSSRFTARQSYYDDSVIEILVDDEKTVSEVGSMELICDQGLIVSSNKCAKAMRHTKAPWVCGFTTEAIQKLKGAGTLRIFNRSDNLLIENEIDFETINRQFNFEIEKGQLTLPEKIGVYLRPSQDGEMLPEIVLTAFAGSGCDQVGDLRITRGLKLNQPNIYTKGGHIDILEIQVKGYDFKKAIPSSDIVCPAVIEEARAVIELSEVMTKQELQLKIILDNQANEFGLNHYENVVYLNPIITSQVISWNPGENMPDQAQGIGFMTKSFQERLAQVRLNGSYAQKSDLGTRLRDYVRNSGYKPLDEKLQGYPQMKPLDEFIVFVPNEKEIPEKFKIIGEVNYHEIIGGDKQINVGIVKKAINPFFVRY